MDAVNTDRGSFRARWGEFCRQAAGELSKSEVWDRVFADNPDIRYWGGCELITVELQVQHLLDLGDEDGAWETWAREWASTEIWLLGILEQADKGTLERAPAEQEPPEGWAE